ncbi:PucR family transcriptional regulator [Streptomyces sp. NRRL S-118]|uniref:PucR family transcriptional regulator n=1 Tax=Streptomyces sp. NRRL S-118 TaxID=1463881 RepID=UPI003B63D6B5
MAFSFHPLPTAQRSPRLPRRTRRRRSPRRGHGSRAGCSPRAAPRHARGPGCRPVATGRRGTGAEPYDDGHSVTRGAEASLAARFGTASFCTTKNGRLICIAPGDQADVLTCFAKQAHAATDGGRVAVGRARPGVGGVVPSYEEALNALGPGERMNLDDPLLPAADLLVHPVPAPTGRRWPTSYARFAARSGEPGAPADTLTAYFDTGCVAAEAARRLSLSVRVVTYRLERIRQPTGTDPGGSRGPLRAPDGSDRCPPVRLAREGGADGAPPLAGGAGRHPFAVRPCSWA